jgi:hypothetical protein
MDVVLESTDLLSYILSFVPKPDLYIGDSPVKMTNRFFLHVCQKNRFTMGAIWSIVTADDLRVEVPVPGTHWMTTMPIGRVLMVQDPLPLDVPRHRPTPLNRHALAPLSMLHIQDKAEAKDKKRVLNHCSPPKRAVNDDKEYPPLGPCDADALEWQIRHDLSLGDGMHRSEEELDKLLSDYTDMARRELFAQTMLYEVVLDRNLESIDLSALWKHAPELLDHVIGNCVWLRSALQVWCLPLLKWLAVYQFQLERVTIAMHSDNAYGREHTTILVEEDAIQLGPVVESLHYSRQKGYRSNECMNRIDNELALLLKHCVHLQAFGPCSLPENAKGGHSLTLLKGLAGCESLNRLHTFILDPLIESSNVQEHEEYQSAIAKVVKLAGSSLRVLEIKNASFSPEPVLAALDAHCKQASLTSLALHMDRHGADHPFSDAMRSLLITHADTLLSLSLEFDNNLDQEDHAWFSQLVRTIVTRCTVLAKLRLAGLPSYAPLHCSRFREGNALLKQSLRSLCLQSSMLSTWFLQSDLMEHFGEYTQLTDVDVASFVFSEAANAYLPHMHGFPMMFDD